MQNSQLPGYTPNTAQPALMFQATRNTQSRNEDRDQKHAHEQNPVFLQKARVQVSFSVTQCQKSETKSQTTTLTTKILPEFGASLCTQEVCSFPVSEFCTLGPGLRYLRLQTLTIAHLTQRHCVVRRMTHPVWIPPL